MAQMGKYCKAYPVTRLREFQEWKPNTENLRADRTQVDGNQGEEPREVQDDGYLYLQENYVVTDGIYIDQNIIFDNVTPEWIDFCKQTLKFEAPA
jgi:hypothetical protein